VGFGDLLEGEDFFGGGEDLFDSTECACTEGLNDVIFGDVVGVLGGGEML
jgi:hypothetical protein